MEVERSTSDTNVESKGAYNLDSELSISDGAPSAIGTEISLSGIPPSHTPATVAIPDTVKVKPSVEIDWTLLKVSDVIPAVGSWYLIIWPTLNPKKFLPGDVSVFAETSILTVSFDEKLDPVESESV